MKKQIKVMGKEINLFLDKNEDYICLTDMVKSTSDSSGLINKWIRNKNTIEFIGIWEKIHNSNFNYIEFGIIRSESGTNRFMLSIKEWLEKTNAIGINAKTGRYGGTYAHIDIALEFASWISPEFKLYLIEEFKRLKKEESFKNNLDWNIKRILTKINYKIHTTAIKENLIPQKLTKLQIKKIYETEADILNIVLFGKTAKDWKAETKSNSENLRDNANIFQLVCLSNLENLNSVFIKDGLKQSERLVKLNEIAISQMKILLKNKIFKKLKNN